MPEAVGFPVDFGKMYQLQRMKTCMCKTFGKKKLDQRLPVTIEMLKQWVQFIDWTNYDQVVLFTAIIVAFFGLCRTSEFAANTQQVRFSKFDVHSYHALWLSNTSFKLGKNNKIKYCKLNIRSSKIDVFKQSVEIVLGRMAPPICPVFMISKMLSFRQTLAQVNRRVKLEYFMPLFCLSNGKIVTKRNISKFLKGLAIISGLNIKLYKPYSLRIGGATYLAQR